MAGALPGKLPSKESTPDESEWEMVGDREETRRFFGDKLESGWDWVGDTANEAQSAGWFCVMPQYTDLQKSRIFHFPTATRNLIDGFAIQSPHGKTPIPGFWDSKKARWRLTLLLKQIETDMNRLPLVVNGRQYTRLDELLKIFTSPPTIGDLKKTLNGLPPKIRVGILSFLCTLQSGVAPLCIYATEKKILPQTQIAVAGTGSASTRIEAAYDLENNLWKTRIEQDLDVIDLANPSLVQDRITVIAEISQENATFTWQSRGAPAREAQLLPQIPPR